MQRRLKPREGRLGSERQAMMTASIEALRGCEADFARQMAALLKMVDSSPCEASAVELQRQFHRVVGRWRAMFVLRDALIYLPIMTGGDQPRAIAAASCRRRIEALAEEVEDFARSWSSSALIATAFPRFRASLLILAAAIAWCLDGERRALADGDPLRLVA